MCALRISYETESVNMRRVTPVPVHHHEAYRRQSDRTRPQQIYLRHKMRGKAQSQNAYSK